MRWPKISIVTPSYNQGKFIERTVRSVLLQRYPDLEYIIMDGGSTDDTVERLQPYQDKFSYFVSERDHGQADAIAKGFARSSGQIMAYLNSDDLLAPDALFFVATFFRDNPNIDWIYSHRCTVDEDDRVVTVLDFASAPEFFDAALGLYSAGNLFLAAEPLSRKPGISIAAIDSRWTTTFLCGS